MNNDELDEMLARTLDDLKLSRGEKRVLGKVFAEYEGDASRLAVARSRAFDIARERLSNSDDARVVSWLEGLVKVLAKESKGGSSASSGRADAFFSPDETCPTRIRGLIDGCRRSLDICVFTITDNRLSSAIVAAHKRGVKVRIVTDNDKSEDLGSDVDELDRSGVEVRVDRTSNHMHHKFAIFDGALLLTVSYNWTRSAAQRNQENFVVMDHPHLLKACKAQFEVLWRKFG